jgi:hypothetical protein
MDLPSTVVLSELEFDVVWESMRFPRRHVVLDVPSPGVTRRERGELVRAAWRTLTDRGLADGDRLESELADRLALLAHPQCSVDAWVWTDREIRGFAVRSGRDAMLAVIDRGKVWLIPAHDSSFVEAAVSIAGECPPGYGRSVSVPLRVFVDADQHAGGDPKALIVELSDRDVPLAQAQWLSGMCDGISGKGQFGVERTGSGRTHGGERPRRADRVIAFHDTARGRYLYVTQPSADQRIWATVTPADNARIAASVWELLDEV